MDEELPIIDQIASVNERLTSMEMLPSEVSGRSHRAFLGAVFSNSPMDWPGMYPHMQNAGRLRVNPTDEQIKYRDTLIRQREESQRKLMDVYDNMRRQEFQEGLLNIPNQGGY